MKASPFEEIDVSISFDNVLSVSGGTFSWVMTGIEIPLLLNSFTITAENTALLRASVVIEGISITISSAGIDGLATLSKSIDGLATLSQSIDQAGSYQVEISGVAVGGATSIPLTITVTSTIETDQDGNFVYSLNTKDIPVGEFTAIIGDVTKVIHLSLRPSPPPSNKAPVAVSDHPDSGVVGEPVLFNASSSYDLDNDLSGYSWSFGDGSSMTGETVSHIYTVPGKYSVLLSVMDVYGATGSTATEIEIKHNARVVSRNYTPITVSIIVIILVTVTGWKIYTDSHAHS